MDMLSEELQNTKRLQQKTKLELNKGSGFSSLTVLLLEMSRSQTLQCPGCRKPLNFENGVDWQGPMDVTCRYCKTLINIKTLLQL